MEIRVEHNTPPIIVINAGMKPTTNANVLQTHESRAR
jgi:hypothetical protein